MERFFLLLRKFNSMKKLVLFPFILFLFTLSAQQLINNKGNRNQPYPVITETKSEVINLINQVSQDNIENHIRYMQNFHRVATSPEALIVHNWLVENFESYGYDDVSVHYFIYNSQQLDAGNVVVIKRGTEFPDDYIMITAHYDHSTYQNPSGPGADDNASGTAGVLECARLLINYPTKRSIMFVLFNAEEFWMEGSLPFAQKCATENMNIVAHFNMDMIGWFPPENPNTIMASGYSYISKALFDYYQQTANIYIPSIPTIRFSNGDSYGGDHMPFNMYEYPSLYIGDIEYIDDHPCYHQPCDTLGHGVNRLDLAKAFVQATLAAASELANAWSPPHNLSACSGMNNITVSWENPGNVSSYKVYKNNTFLIETTENSYIDYGVEIGHKYEYYVIAIHQENGQESTLSNKDEVTFVTSLQLPYSNNFSVNKYGFEQSDWVCRSIGGKSALCNTGDDGRFTDNYLSITELNWFSISDNTENISIRFKWRGDIRGIWSWNENGTNARMFFEVTNDRKTWHKLAYMTNSVLSWKDYEFSLNDYIGSDFFQARFRLESSGSQKYSYIKIGYITDVEVDYALKIDDKKESSSYISSFNFFPNPANDYIYIVTNQHEPYHIAIYDMTGRVVFEQEGFKDGVLGIAHLKKGNYLIVVSTKKHRMARKLVIQWV